VEHLWNDTPLNSQYKDDTYMVLESLSNPFRAEQHPGWLALHGALYAIIAMALALWLWPDQASMVAVFLITAASIPLLYNMIRYEEEKDFHEMEEKILLREHSRAVLAYFMLFVGVTLGMAFIFIVLPEETLRTAFDVQIDTYRAINPSAAVVGAVTGQVTGGSMSFFTAIFLNNIKVLLFCIVFSFLFGAGAIFILTWNASVIAMAIGNHVRSEVAAVAGAAGLTKLGLYLSEGAYAVVLRYGIHGSLEIIAYIVAGLAGGIISVAVARHHFSERKFEHIIIDSADLVLLSLLILFLEGVVDAFITPVFYL
jgi:uncharacterized membrane protein SpoIIM required for sporulation